MSAGGQIGLHFPPLERDAAATYRPGASNAAARAALAAPDAWPTNAMALVGAAASGKSHLARLWAQERDAVWVDAAAPDARFAPALEAVEQGRNVVVDDADRPNDAEGLFALLNAARHARGAALVLTARQHPHAWPVAEGFADLASRLKALPVATIEEPDDEEFAALVVKLFADRGVIVDESFISYVHARIERSYAAAIALVEDLDRRALAAKSRVTRALARSYFQEQETGLP